MYYSSGSVSGENKDTLLASSAPAFSMYLANGQVTGQLPIFKKDYYVHIFWKNINLDKIDDGQYVYTTKDYDPILHGDELEGYKTHIETDQSGNPVVDDNGNSVFSYVWNYSDGYAVSNINPHITFEAYYFRKSYQVEIQTLVDESIERRGYVHVYVDDKLYKVDNTIENTGANYIIIAENATMKIYKIDDGANDITQISLTSYLDLNKTYKLNTNKLIDGEILQIYGGCDLIIRVKDQSQDTTAMFSEEFDEMIGYKFNGRISQTTQTNKLFADLTENQAYGYYHLFDAVTIENKNYANNELIHFNVYYEKINYNLTVKIDNPNYAGEFSLIVADRTSGQQKNYELTDFVVGTYCKINYFAYAGFKLKTNAFVLSNGKATHTLQGYDDQTNIRQAYTLTKHFQMDNLFDGTWLREYFYKNYTDYAVDLKDLGDLIIQTEAIQFNYGVKVYDETTGVLEERYIIETFEDGSIVLNSTTGVANTNSVGTYLKMHDAGFYYYDSLTDGTDYALLNSRLYFPNNYTTKNDNDYTTYDFLLIGAPSQQSQLRSLTLAMMVEDYEEGVIVPKAQRNIYIMLEVRKMFEITISVDATNVNDTNDSTRTTTISNGNANLKQVVVNIDATKIGDNFINSAGSSVAKLHTYYGLENNLTSQFDKNRYSDVEYNLDGVVLTSNSFMVDANAELEIYYVPKNLKVEFVYLLDGENVQLSNLEGYIKEDVVYKPTELNVYYLSNGKNKVPYAVDCVHNDYNVRVTINNKVMGTTDNVVRSLRFIAGETDTRYEVSSQDFNMGKIEIVVEVFLKDSTKINVRFQLRDSNKSFEGDEFGTFTIYTIYNSTEEVLASNISLTEVRVVEAKDVYVVVNLKEGYEFVGYKHGTDNMESVTLDESNSFLLIGGFDPDVSGGDYLIVIDKISVTATLNVEGLKAQYYINGKTNLTNLFVGSTIEFTNVDVNEERLGCFYYIVGNDKVYLTDNGTENGNPLTNLTITSELLKTIGGTTINFGVVAVNRYKVDVEITGQEYLAQNGFTVNYCDDSSGDCVVGEEYILGTYCDEETQISFSVTPLVVGKFDINVVETTNDQNFDQIKVGDIVTTFNRDYSYSITISPKQYSVKVEEFVYETISELLTSNPNEVLTDDHVNNMSATGQKYNETATLEFVRNIAGDRCLYSICISDNDMGDEIVIKFDGVDYMSTVNGLEISLADCGYTIEVLENNKIKLTYITLNNISLRLEYKDYKVINIG